MAMVIPHLQSPDARVRYGVLSVVDAICLGCEVRMKSDLESLLAVLFPLVADGSAGVVIQLLNTLMTLMESLFPESEKYISSVVTTAIPLILHPHPRVSSIAMDLVVVGDCVGMRLRRTSLTVCVMDGGRQTWAKSVRELSPFASRHQCSKMS
jgi:hypothetical protein